MGSKQRPQNFYVSERGCYEFEHSQASKMELFVKVFHSLDIGAFNCSTQSVQLASYSPIEKLHLGCLIRFCSIYVSESCSV